MIDKVLTIFIALAGGGVGLMLIAVGIYGLAIAIGELREEINRRKW